MLRADDLDQRVAGKTEGERAFAERGGEGTKGDRGQVLEWGEHQMSGGANSAPMASTLGTTSARSRKSLSFSQEISAMRGYPRQTPPKSC